MEERQLRLSVYARSEAPLESSATAPNKSGMSNPPVGLEPGKPLERGGAGIVFAADIAVVAEPVELGEQEGEVQLLAVRLVSRRDGGDLDVADDRLQRAERHRYVPMQDLPMIHIELKLHIGSAEAADERARIGEIVEEIGGHVACVDRLENEIDVALGEDRGCIRNRAPVARLSLRVRTRGVAGHHVHTANLGRSDIIEHAGEAGLEFVEPCGQRRETALAILPAARRQVEQGLSEAIALKPLGDRLGGMVIRKQKLDRGEARFRRRVETVEERVLGEHHRQVCGKLGQCFCSDKAIAYVQTEPSARGAKRRGDPGDVERPATPGLIAVARPEGRASLDALWLAMTTSGSLRIQIHFSVAFAGSTAAPPERPR